jgi:uncharacterized membrane protein required for colicin V production
VPAAAVSLNVVDWIALLVIALSTLGGFRRGLVASALSFVGLAGGAYLGSRIGPHLLRGGTDSGWTPVAGLVGAVAGAMLLQAVASVAGAFVRGGLKLAPLRLADSLGGLIFGAATGIAFVWVLGATALLAPGQSSLRRSVQQSAIVRRLDEAVSPRQLLHLLARIDPFPSIVGPEAPSAPLSPRITHNTAVSRASGDVVRVLGTACGVGVEGTGWFATRHLVVTAAHVVAGERDTSVQVPGDATLRGADVVAYDSHDDVAVLRVSGVTAPQPLRLADPKPGASVAIVGYPENGPLTATPGRVGRTAVVLTRDAYGNGPISRTITAVAGRVRHGDSGGPAIDGAGHVESTIFAARVGAPSGYGVPASVVRRVLASANEPVSTGSCTAG